MIRRTQQREIQEAVKGSSMQAVLYALVEVCHACALSAQGEANYAKAEHWRQICRILTLAEDQSKRLGL